MAKIIVEHVTKKPKVKLSVFVDGANVGNVSHKIPLNVDVASGDHLMHIGLSKKKMNGEGVAFHVGENETKKIHTRLPMSALSAARWHYYLFMAAVMMFVMVATRLLMGKMVRLDFVMLALIFLSASVPVYFIMEAKHKKNPKNFVEIEVLE